MIHEASKAHTALIDTPHVKDAWELVLFLANSMFMKSMFDSHKTMEYAYFSEDSCTAPNTGKFLRIICIFPYRTRVQRM